MNSSVSWGSTSKRCSVSSMCVCRCSSSLVAFLHQVAHLGPLDASPRSDPLRLANLPQSLQQLRGIEDILLKTKKINFGIM